LDIGFKNLGRRRIEDEIQKELGVRGIEVEVIEIAFKDMNFLDEIKFWSRMGEKDKIRGRKIWRDGKEIGEIVGLKRSGRDVVLRLEIRCGEISVIRNLMKGGD